MSALTMLVKQALKMVDLDKMEVNATEFFRSLKPELKEGEIIHSVLILEVNNVILFNICAMSMNGSLTVTRTIKQITFPELLNMITDATKKG